MGWRFHARMSLIRTIVHCYDNYNEYIELLVIVIILIMMMLFVIVLSMVIMIKADIYPSDHW